RQETGEARAHSTHEGSSWMPPAGYSPLRPTSVGDSLNQPQDVPALVPDLDASAAACFLFQVTPSVRGKKDDVEGGPFFPDPFRQGETLAAARSGERQVGEDDVERLVVQRLHRPLEGAARDDLEPFDLEQGAERV